MRLKDFNNMSLDERKNFMKEREIPIDYEIKRKTENEDWYMLTYICRYCLNNCGMLIIGPRKGGKK